MRVQRRLQAPLSGATRRGAPEQGSLREACVRQASLSPTQPHQLYLGVSSNKGVLLWGPYMRDPIALGVPLIFLETPI